MSTPTDHDPPVASDALPSHPDYGLLLARRRKGVADWVVYSLLALLLLFPVVSFFVISVLPPYTGNLAIPWWGRPLCFAGGLLFTWMMFLIYDNLSRTISFHERGVIHRRFGRVRSDAPFEQISMLNCSTTRHYYNGIYVGTALAITIKAPGRKTISFACRHKEKSAGLGFTLFYKKMKGEDEIDTIKLIIARAMVGALLAAPAEFSLDWAGTGTFSPAGFTPKRGPLRATLVPYQQFRRVAAEKGWFHCWRHDEKRPFVTVSLNGNNFYPGLELLAIMQSGLAETQTASDAPEIEAHTP